MSENNEEAGILELTENNEEAVILELSENNEEVGILQLTENNEEVGILQLTENNDFIFKHKKEIDIITNHVIEIIKASNIQIDVEQINTTDVLKIVSQISKAINKMKTLKNEINDLSDSDKAAILFEITIMIINSDQVSKYLSQKVKDQILNFTENGKVVNEVANLVDWASDEVLEGYDTNKDGIITSDEIEQSCSCCPKGLSKCWASFFISFLCCRCGKKEIRYS